ncbi:MAG: hypothetical protein ABJC24_06750, partial [Chloroflexota bacterium]
EPVERDLIGRASVVGKIFQRSAIAELSPPERRSDLGARLMTLVRKELVRPDRSATTGDEAFRFRHLLVRDAAYASLTKEQRADLHARFADWLERIAGDRLLEYEEVIGYHLEQAHRYRSELGLTDELTTVLSNRAATRLRAAGTRALARNDLHAASNLLSRSAALVGDERERSELLLHVADSTAMMGDLVHAKQWQQQARDAAANAGDDILEMRAELEQLGLTWFMDPTFDEGRILDLTDRLAALGVERGDKQALVAAELARADVFLSRCRWTECFAALDRARALIDPLEDPRRWRLATGFRWNALRWGPVPADEAIARIDADEPGNETLAFARLSSTAPLLAMQDLFDEARARIEAGKRYVSERGLQLLLGGIAFGSGTIETLAGDLEAAVREFALGIDALGPMGETGARSTLVALQAGVLYRLGRRDEMDAALQLSRDIGAPNDISTQAIWRTVAGMAAADDGHLDRAEELVDEAVALVEPTDFLEMRAEAFEALAHINARAGRMDGWTAALQRALAEHEQKANLVAAKRVRELLEQGPG